MLYYSLVYSHLNYATEVWGSADATHLDRIFILQKRIVRMMTHNDTRHQDYSFSSSDPLFLKLQILKIRDIFELKISKFIYRCFISKDTPVNFHHWFIPTTQVHHHNTGTKSKIIGDNIINTNNLFIPITRTTHYGLKQIKGSRT